MQIRQAERFNLSYSDGRKAKSKNSFPDLSIHVDSSSKNNNQYFNQRPLNHYSKELSFKGLSISNVKVDDAAAVLKKVGSVLGNTFEEKYGILAKTYASRIIKKGDSVEFVRKSIPKMVGESLAYPFVQMPFDLLDFGLNIMKKVPGVKKAANSIYNSDLLTKKRNALAKEEDFNAVMGMFDQVSKKMKASKDGDDKLDEWILNTFQKYFDPKTGKYNTVHERSLNRIVSGMVPAFFLANDAYNLSRFCDDNPEMAKKEHDTRFKQELSRVGVTAYIQLVILGGLTKFVNSSLMGTALSSTIPVLIAETSSRLANGKSITFISKDKAKQMAQEQGVISVKNEPQKEENDLIYKYYPMPVAFKSKVDKTFTAFNSMNSLNSAAFSSFAPESVVNQTAEIVSMHTRKRDKKNREKKKDGGLLTLGLIKKAMLTSIAVGFGVRALRANKNIDKAFNSFFGVFKDGYNNLVKKDFLISKTEFSGIVEKLRATGFNEIATQYEKIMKTHNEDFATLSKLLQEMLQKVGTQEFAKMAKDNAALLKRHNINPNNIHRTIRANVASLEAIPSDMYKMAKVDKKIKPAVDFVIAPFKFMWATAKFPYTIVNNLVSLVVKQKKTKTTSSIDTLTKSLLDLKGKANLPEKDFQKYIKTAMCSSFNNISKSDYSNADLGKLTKLFASTVTTWFLIADDYNMVMMKSLGQDESGAALKAKERLQQRLTGIFYQTLFIDLFNNTFSKVYHTSLLGMSAVTAACTTICEIFTRKSIGKPVGHMSRDEINDLEYRNINAPGLKGKYFRFMTELTGKKAVSEDANKKKAKAQEKRVLA